MVDIPIFMYGLGFISGMIFVWAFAAAHDAIVNFYRELVYRKSLKKEKELVKKTDSDVKQ